MKRSITFALAAGAAFALAGCSAGLQSQTAQQVAPVPGFSTTYQLQGTERGSIQIRNAHLPFPGVDGYQAGSTAPVKIWLFNETTRELRVVIKSDAGTVEPSAPIVIPPAGMAAPEIRLTGLKQAVSPGGNVDVQVELVGLDTLTVPLPVAPPDSPTERTPEPARAEPGAGGH